MAYKGKYESIVESTIVRYQSGGVLPGDLIKVSPKALSHPKLKGISDQYKQVIQRLIDEELNLRITAIKSTRPSSVELSDGVGMGMTNAPTDHWVDVVIETKPGLFSDPVTLPIEVVEVIDTGINLAPIPDKLKRKGKINIKPEEMKYGPTYSIPDHDTRTLPSKNTKLDFTKGSAEHKNYVKENSRINDHDALIEAYASMSKPSKKYIVSIANAFADNIERFLAVEGIRHRKDSVGQTTNFIVDYEDDATALEKTLKENVMGDMTFLKVCRAAQQLEES